CRCLGRVFGRTKKRLRPDEIVGSGGGQSDCRFGDDGMDLDRRSSRNTVVRAVPRRWMDAFGRSPRESPGRCRAARVVWKTNRAVERWLPGFRYVSSRGGRELRVLPASSHRLKQASANREEVGDCPE